MKGVPPQGDYEKYPLGYFARVGSGLRAHLFAH